MAMKKYSAAWFALQGCFKYSKRDIADLNFWMGAPHNMTLNAAIEHLKALDPCWKQQLEDTRRWKEPKDDGMNPTVRDLYWKSEVFEDAFRDLIGGDVL